MRLVFALVAAIGAGPVVAQDGTAWRDSSEAYWRQVEAEFRDSSTSPLTLADRLHFDHLQRFPYDPAYRVEARFKPARRMDEFDMKTSTARTPKYRTMGRLVFRLKGRTFKLPVYQNVELSKRPEYVNYLFLPFTDLTNGEETYGGGRYVDLHGPLGERVTIDLNNAYNPYCAYSDRYSCPIPPAENHLDTEVRAGVKKYHD